MSNDERYTLYGTLPGREPAVITYEYFPEADERYISSGCKGYYLTDIFTNNIEYTPESIAAAVHPDDVSLMMKFAADIRALRSPAAVIIRLKDRNGGYDRFLLTGAVIVTGSHSKRAIGSAVKLENFLSEHEALIASRRELAESLDESEKSNVLYHLLLDETETMIFEYNVGTDSLTYSLLMADKTRHEVAIENYASDFFDRQTKINPEERDLFIKTLDEAKKRPMSGTADFRCDFYLTGRYRWYRSFYRSTAGPDGRVNRIVGRIDDINEEKNYADMLLDKAERDSLTSLYNHEATELHINEALAGGDRGTLFVIDIDHFKMINDTFGHLLGDEYLKSAANKLMDSFPEGISGRIGGDEFALYLPGTRPADSIAAAAQTILDIFGSISIPKLSNVGCSVGAASVALNDNNYLTVFRKADLALYEAKSVGRGSYYIYDETTSDTGSGNIHQSILASKKYREYVDNMYSDTGADLELVSRILDIISDKNEAGRKMSSVLTLICGYFEVSRAYIYGVGPDNKSICGKICEHCAEGIKPRNTNAPGGTNLCKSLMPYFNDSGVLYIRDTANLPDFIRGMLEAQSIRSILVFRMTAFGRCTGFIGVDDCRGPRELSDLTQGTMHIISQLMGHLLAGEAGRPH